MPIRCRACALDRKAASHERNEFHESVIQKRKNQLDLNVFQQCTFVDCIFSFLGMGPIVLEQCTIERGTLELNGPAAIVVKSLWELNRAGFARAVDQVCRDIQSPDPPLLASAEGMMN
jgi:hypothetical protein